MPPSVYTKIRQFFLHFFRKHAADGTVLAPPECFTYSLQILNQHNSSSSSSNSSSSDDEGEENQGEKPGGGKKKGRKKKAEDPLLKHGKLLNIQHTHIG